MLNQRFHLFVTFLCAVILTGCSSVWPLPLMASGSPGAILFEDDFSDSSSGWHTWAGEESVIAYHEGGLRFIINEPQYDYWSRPGKWYQDVRLEVLATMMNGPADNDFGLICRYQDENNFYAFLASSDGYAGIVKVVDGVYQVISAPSLEYQDVILQGPSANHLRAECSGSRLSLAINNRSVAQAEDDTFSEGDIGLMVGAYDTAGVDILFDNFVALQP